MTFIYHPAPALYQKVFDAPWKARQAGFLSKTAWKTRGRIVKDDNIPSLVVLKTADAREPPCGLYHLEDLGDNRFIVADDYFLVYGLDQTLPKQQKPKKQKPQRNPSKKASRPVAEPPAFYVPVNLPHILTDHRRDYAHYFLNLIHWRSINWRADERGFVYLKHDYLAKVIPKPVLYDIREKLVAEGIVEWDEIYQKGTKAYGFKVADAYRKTHRIVCTDPAIAKAIRRLEENQNKRLLPVHRWLKLKLDRLEFDKGRAAAIIDTLEPDWRSPMTTKAYRTLLTEACQKLVEKDFHLSADQYGRVHTPVTNLPRDLRCCLAVGGQKLIGLDLANSQPLIAGIAARQFFKNKQMKQRLLLKKFDDRSNPYCHRELSQLEKQAEGIILANQSANSSTSEAKHNTTHTLPITTYNSSQVSAVHDYCVIRQPLPDSRRDDVEHFINLCERGEFYECLMEPGEDRSWFKRAIYQDVFFGKNSFQSKLKERFASSFPSIAEMLVALKRKDHRQSAWLLQNYEATIFIYSIARRLMDERPDLVIYTIHDSFLFPPSNLNFIRAVIIDEFKKLGLHPTLRDERYD